jgi:hypothetical protein
MPLPTKNFNFYRWGDIFRKKAPKFKHQALMVNFNAKFRGKIQTKICIIVAIVKNKYIFHKIFTGYLYIQKYLSSWKTYVKDWMDKKLPFSTMVWVNIRQRNILNIFNH